MEMERREEEKKGREGKRKLMLPDKGKVHSGVCVGCLPAPSRSMGV